jgi:ligand-binding sensor protein
MKASTSFKETIKNYLDNRAKEDELFAITYQKENKNLEECCNYIMKCAKEGECAGYSDDEVYGWAVHYYDEDDIKNIAPINGKVIINKSVELTLEDIEQAKKQAIEQLISEEKQKILSKSKKKKVESKVEMFGLFDEQ